MPIYKNDNEQLIQNYRPISVLPFFSKIFEKIVSLYFIDYLEDNNLFYYNQFGFRKFHGTNHVIITLVEKVSKTLDTGKFVIGVFLDFIKAFDTVNHTILMKKSNIMESEGGYLTKVILTIENNMYIIMGMIQLPSYNFGRRRPRKSNAISITDI